MSCLRAWWKRAEEGVRQVDKSPLFTKPALDDKNVLVSYSPG
jgi:hypothetical protein